MLSLPPSFILSRSGDDLLDLTIGMLNWIQRIGLVVVLMLLAAFIALPSTGSANQADADFNYEACDANPDCAVFVFLRGNVPHQETGLMPEEEFLGKFPGCTVTGVYSRSYGRMMRRTHTQITFDPRDTRCPDPVTLEQRT